MPLGRGSGWGVLGWSPSATRGVFTETSTPRCEPWRATCYSANVLSGAGSALSDCLPWIGTGPLGERCCRYERRSLERWAVPRSDWRNWSGSAQPCSSSETRNWSPCSWRTLGACGRSPERADRFESTPCQADRRPFRRSEMADLACGRASRRVPDSFYRRRPRDRRLLPQAPKLRQRPQELERSAGLDSRNSGKPPSSDGLGKPPAPAKRTRSLRGVGWSGPLPRGMEAVSSTADCRRSTAVSSRRRTNQLTGLGPLQVNC